MSSWFPSGMNGNEGGWRLDIVSLLAVIGESSIESHSQALTSSKTCILPRIIPAPQVLLKPSRPSRMPQTSAIVVGVHNGTKVDTLNYFPNIIHPVDELPAFSFKVYKIQHRGHGAETAPGNASNATTASIEPRNVISASSSSDVRDVEKGSARPASKPSTALRRRITAKAEKMKESMTGQDKSRLVVYPKLTSPLNILSIFSCVLTLGLLATSVVIRDGTACVALGVISLVSSIVGYASSWQPVLMKRQFAGNVPPGDVIIRTREGAFILVKCDENVARELYFGTEECKYQVQSKYYSILVGLGTFLLMISVVLLGNCNFIMQAAIGSPYMVLNGAFWSMSLINKKHFWDLSSFEWQDITPDDAKDAHRNQGEGISGQDKFSFTRTMWYAIRDSGKAGWVKRSGAAPSTTQWDEWLNQAEAAVSSGNRKWNATEMMEQIVGQRKSAGHDVRDATEDAAAQHVPAVEVELQDSK